MSVYAVVDVSTREVVNSVIWDGISVWEHDEGFIALEGDYSIGSTVPENEMPN